MKKRLAVIVLIMITVLSGCRTAARTDRFEAQSSSAKESLPSSSEQASVFVYICGEVVRPGVYEMDSTDRVKDVIARAGGLTEEADAGAVNQALLLKDQEKIMVPSRNDARAAGGAASAVENGLLDINRATKEQFIALPGIGEIKANAIISYREKTGGFKSVDELLKVEGISSGIFNKIKDSISVG